MLQSKILRKRSPAIAIAIHRACNGYSRCGTFGGSLVHNMVGIYLRDSITV